MDPFENLAEPTAPLSYKCIKMHNMKYIDIGYITKETNYAQIQFSKY